MNVTGTFTATQPMKCVVTVAAQVYAAAAWSGSAGYIRTAMFIDGSAQADSQYGHYMVGNGSTGVQPDVSRTMTWTVLAGQTVSFGIYYGASPTAWNGSTLDANTTYDCA
jgi:hypothetical protein